MPPKVQPLISFDLMYDMIPMYPAPLGCNHSIMRVPGGWVIADMQGSCFVPYNKEFLPKRTRIIQRILNWFRRRK